MLRMKTDTRSSLGLTKYAYLNFHLLFCLPQNSILIKKRAIIQTNTYSKIKYIGLKFSLIIEIKSNVRL